MSRPAPLRLIIAQAIDRFHWSLDETLRTDCNDLMWLLHTIAEIDRVKNETDDGK